MENEKIEAAVLVMFDIDKDTNEITIGDLIKVLQERYDIDKRIVLRKERLFIREDLLG